MAVDATTSAIIAELYTALEELGAEPELLATVREWGKTLSDDDVLTQLRAFNRTGTIFERIIWDLD
ncbi:hypothetical protein [Aminobacter sp. HY435]|uniref:hypothetical protein n=1 Tax=Aminobacter sp. HY435 TaxID=2970917 RepID=UPI0022B955CC|nr:hypothetical protein [Aminobacter sp. HY435]